MCCSVRYSVHHSVLQCVAVKLPSCDALAGSLTHSVAACVAVCVAVCVTVCIIVCCSALQSCCLVVMHLRDLRHTVLQHVLQRVLQCVAQCALQRAL